MKRCSKCKETKSKTEFYKLKRAKDGLQSECKECASQYKKQWRINNPEKVKQFRKQWQQTHKDIIAHSCSQWKKDNKDKWNAYIRSYRQKPQNYIASKLREQLSYAIQNNRKTGNIIHLLGCSIEFLKGYITAQFTDEMSWENYGSVWSIDHAMPFRLFDLTKEEELLIVCNWKNVRPLLIADNSSKRFDKERDC